MAEPKAKAAAEAVQAQEVKAEEGTKFKSVELAVKIEGIAAPIRTMSQNPNDEAKAKRGMKCMQCLKPTLVKSIHTGLTYVFPQLSPVWVHKTDVNLCGSKGASHYDPKVKISE